MSARGHGAIGDERNENNTAKGAARGVQRCEQGRLNAIRFASGSRYANVRAGLLKQAGIANNAGELQKRRRQACQSGRHEQDWTAADSRCKSNAGQEESR